MFRKSVASKQRQYPNDQGYNVYSNNSTYDRPSQQQWSYSQQHQEPLQYNQPTLYNPNAFQGGAHQQVYQSQHTVSSNYVIATDFNQPASYSSRRPISGTEGSSDPWDWNLNNSNESTSNVHNQNIGTNVQQQESNVDWNNQWEWDDVQEDEKQIRHVPASTNVPYNQSNSSVTTSSYSNMPAGNVAPCQNQFENTSSSQPSYFEHQRVADVGNCDNRLTMAPQHGQQTSAMHYTPQQYFQSNQQQSNADVIGHAVDNAFYGSNNVTRSAVVQQHYQHGYASMDQHHGSSSENVNSKFPPMQTTIVEQRYLSDGYNPVETNESMTSVENAMPDSNKRCDTQENVELSERQYDDGGNGSVATYFSGSDANEPPSGVVNDSLPANNYNVASAFSSTLNDVTQNLNSLRLGANFETENYDTYISNCSLQTVNYSREPSLIDLTENDDTSPQILDDNSRDNLIKNDNRVSSNAYEVSSNDQLTDYPNKVIPVDNNESINVGTTITSHNIPPRTSPMEQIVNYRQSTGIELRKHLSDSENVDATRSEQERGVENQEVICNEPVMRPTSYQDKKSDLVRSSIAQESFYEQKIEEPMTAGAEQTSSLGDAANDVDEVSTDVIRRDDTDCRELQPKSNTVSHVGSELNREDVTSASIYQHESFNMETLSENLEQPLDLVVGQNEAVNQQVATVSSDNTHNDSPSASLLQDPNMNPSITLAPPTPNKDPFSSSESKNVDHFQEKQHQPPDRSAPNISNAAPVDDRNDPPTSSIVDGTEPNVDMPILCQKEEYDDRARCTEPPVEEMEFNRPGYESEELLRERSQTVVTDPPLRGDVTSEYGDERNEHQLVNNGQQIAQQNLAKVQDDEIKRYDDQKPAGFEDNVQDGDDGGPLYVGEQRRFDDPRIHYDDDKPQGDDSRSRYYDDNGERNKYRSNYEDGRKRDDSRSRYDEDKRISRDSHYDDDRRERSRSRYNARYNDYEVDSRHRYDRRGHASSRYDDEIRRDLTRSHYDGRGSRDISPLSEYDRRDHPRYGNHYDGRDSRDRNDYYNRRRDDSITQRDVKDRPSSRQGDSGYRGYDDRYSSRDYYRDRSGYIVPYDRMAQDYLYRQFYDGYRSGNSITYNYGYYDKLYHTDPRCKEQIEKYRDYYLKNPAAYASVDYDRPDVPSSSGRNSATDGQRRSGNDTFSQEFQPDSILGYDISSINAECSPNFVNGYIPEGDIASPQIVAQEPYKFTSPHVLARFSPSGQLIKVLPHQPKAGQVATVEICDIRPYFESRPEVKELLRYPGPLIVGETHKKDVIQFCQNKIRYIEKDSGNLSDKESVILLWEYLMLLLRQNGSVAGTDLADLLLKNHSFVSKAIPIASNVETVTPDEGICDSGTSHVTHSMKPSPDDSDELDGGVDAVDPRSKTMEYVADKFREYLLFGHKKDALEWAIKNELWGHALFLASKMDKRTYAMILTKFANSLSFNDPLQTLYQLMSGRQPASVTCVADEKWGDWRQHLAMILSNPTNKPNVDSKSVMVLGDTLANRGCLHAAHCCYLMSNLNFGIYSHNSSKIVLIGSSHQKAFEQFATNEAIQCTEIYEYARKLAQPSFKLPHFQQYKFIYAGRLADIGCSEEVLHYCEILSFEIQKTPAVYSQDLVSQVYDLGCKLKYHDPYYTHNEGDPNELGDPQWLINLGTINQAYKLGTIQHVVETDFVGSQSSLATNEYDQRVLDNNNQYIDQQQIGGGHGANNDQYQLQQNDPSYNTAYNLYGQQHQQLGSDQVDHNLAYQQQQYSSPYVKSNEPNQADVQNNYDSNDHGQQWGNYGHYSNYEKNDDNESMKIEDSTLTDYTSSSSPPVVSSSKSFDYYSSSIGKTNRDRKASESSTSSMRRSSRRESTSLSTDAVKSDSGLPESSLKKDSNEKRSANSKQQQNGGGLLYGLFQKLSFKPKNQMILPDDKNPTIVWNPDTKQWMNTDGDEDDSVKGPAAPPKDSEMPGSVPPTLSSKVTQLTVPTVPKPALNSSGANKFQRIKSKNMRANYVDVFGASGSQSTTSVPTSLLPPDMNSKPNISVAPNLFIPSSVSSNEPDLVSQNTVVLNAANVDKGNDIDSQPAELSSSRCSSQSSLSKEVQSYMIPKNEKPGMTMYNPTEFDNATVASNQGSKATRRHQIGYQS